MNFDQFIDELSDLRQSYVHEETPSDLVTLAKALQSHAEITRPVLIEILREDPERLAVLVTSVGLSREQLKNQLSHRFRTSSVRKVVAARIEELAAWLCDDLALLPELTRDLGREWTLADVYFERRRWTSRSASNSITRGRSLENEVERIVRSAGTGYAMRTTFVGAREQIGSCDFAIPAGGDNAKIIGAVKGFNSTGSKLTDAVREITDLADKRLPRQFVFAVIDGLGWLNRRADLARIVALRQSQAIDGLYTRRLLPQFRLDLNEALRRLGVATAEAEP